MTDWMREQMWEICGIGDDEFEEDGEEEDEQT